MQSSTATDGTRCWISYCRDLVMMRRCILFEECNVFLVTGSEEGENKTHKWGERRSCPKVMGGRRGPLEGRRQSHKRRRRWTIVGDGVNEGVRENTKLDKLTLRKSESERSMNAWMRHSWATRIARTQSKNAKDRFYVRNKRAAELLTNL